MQINFLKSKIFAEVVSIIDVLFALIVVTPLVVTFWSTTWTLYDLFIFPNDPFLSIVVSWSFGFYGQMVLMFYQDPLKKLLVFEKHTFVNASILKIYALFLAHISVSFWRGVWSFVDATSAKGLPVVILNMVQNTIILMILKTFRNTLGPPFFVSTDHQEQYNMRTFLEKQKANGNLTYLVDCLTTMFVEMLIAFIWHDLYFIHDSIIFPDDLFSSALTSLVSSLSSVIGYSSAIICFALQSFTGILCEKYDDQKVYIFYAFTVIVLLSAVNVWRGVWSFVLYFVGDNKEWNLILNTLAWTSLMVINCTFSLTAKDVYKDAEESGRDCTKFQAQYFSEIMLLKTEKKSDQSETISTQL